MATAEKRTLSIEARLKDHLTVPVREMERTLRSFGVGGLIGLKKLAGGFLSLKTAVVGLVAAYGGMRALGAIREFGEQADALLKLAGTTGDTIANLSELQAAFDLSGVKADDFDTVLRALQNAQRDATDGSAKTIEGFTALGISLEQVRQLAPSQMFEQIAAGLGELGNEFDRQVALSRLLPKQFQALMPILGGGLREFQKAILEARASGATVTAEQAKIAAQMNDAITKVTLAMGSVGRALIETFGPRTTAMLETLAKGIVANRDGIVQVASAIGTLVVAAIDKALDGIINLVQAIEWISGNLLDSDKLKAQLHEATEQFKKASDEWERLAVAMVNRSPEAIEAARLRMKEAWRQMQDIVAAKDGGLAGAMRASKQNLQKELGDLTSMIKRSASENAPQDTTQTAAALGLPTPKQVEDYATEVWSLIPVGPQPAKGNRPSVFQPAPRVDENVGRPSDGSGPNGLGISQGQIAGIVAQVEALARMLKTKAGQAFLALEKRITALKEKWLGFWSVAKNSLVDLADSGLDGLTEAFGSIIDGTKNAGEAFRDFARDMLSQVARIIAKLTIVKALESFGFGAEKGGMLPAMEKGGIMAYADGGVNRNGGIARRPTVLFGEGRNAEAFVPLPDNRSIPVSFVGGGAAGGNTVTINIRAMDSRDVQRALYEQQSTLRTIFTNQAETTHGMRQVIRRAAS